MDKQEPIFWAQLLAGAAAWGKWLNGFLGLHGVQIVLGTLVERGGEARSSQVSPAQRANHHYSEGQKSFAGLWLMAFPCDQMFPDGGGLRFSFPSVSSPFVCWFSLQMQNHLPV